MGNKHNKPAAPSRAHSTTLPPTIDQRATQQQHNRISRRRSEFQQNGGKRQNVDNINNQNASMESANNFGATAVYSRDRSALSINPNGGPVEPSNMERMRQSRRRWSSIANVNPQRTAANHNNHVIKPKRMAARQCHLVIKSWSRRTPKTRVVKDIFIAIFTEAEELRSAFGIEPSSTGKKLRTEPSFISHTNMFADTLDFVIRNLDDLSLVTENAEQLGRRHVSFPLEGGFRPEYWNIFTECIVDGLTASDEDKETHIAWRQLVQTIIYYMKLGYDRETLRLSRHNSFRSSNSPRPVATTTRLAQQQHEQRHSPNLLDSSVDVEDANGDGRHCKSANLDMRRAHLRIERQ